MTGPCTTARWTPACCSRAVSSGIWRSITVNARVVQSVRFPGIAGFLALNAVKRWISQADSAGSIPVTRSHSRHEISVYALKIQRNPRFGRKRGHSRAISQSHVDSTEQIRSPSPRHRRGRFRPIWQGKTRSRGIRSARQTVSFSDPGCPRRATRARRLSMRTSHGSSADARSPISTCAETESSLPKLTAPSREVRPPPTGSLRRGGHPADAHRTSATCVGVVARPSTSAPSASSGGRAQTQLGLVAS